jgi:hypothetical protein
LRAQIGGDLTALQIVVDKISDPDYKNVSYSLKQDYTHAVISVPSIEAIKQREINKCFKSIISSLQDYLDCLLATLNLKKETITNITPLTEKGIRYIIQRKFNDHLTNISTNRSLNIPKKINILLDNPEYQSHKESLQSYFDIRNGLEHHKGIAKADRKIKFKRFAVTTKSGEEIKELSIISGQDSLIFKVLDDEIAYDKGNILMISKKQLDNIVISLVAIIIPAMQKAADDKFKGG